VGWPDFGARLPIHHSGPRQCKEGWLDSRAGLPIHKLLDFIKAQFINIKHAFSFLFFPFPSYIILFQKNKREFFILSLPIYLFFSNIENKVLRCFNLNFSNHLST